MQRRHIFLIGFSGSGKSTVGPVLAKRLKRSFIDTDQLIEKNAGTAISGIFREQGEKRFRKMESEVLDRICRRKAPAVVALGGGAFESGRNRKVIAENGRAIFLRCSARELYRRLRATDDRPLLASQSGYDAPASALKQRIRELAARRLPNYNKADLVVSTTSRTAKETVSLIVRKLDELYDAD